jgi:hypothetical protein
LTFMENWGMIDRCCQNGSLRSWRTQKGKLAGGLLAWTRSDGIVIARSAATKQSRERACPMFPGLLRFARNDDRCSTTGVPRRIGVPAQKKVAQKRS